MTEMFFLAEGCQSCQVKSVSFKTGIDPIYSHNNGLFVVPVAFQHCRGLNGSVLLLSMQAAGKAGCVVENTPRGVSWKMPALLGLLTFRARQHNLFRNYFPLKLYLLKTHDVSFTGLVGQRLDESLLESAVRPAFPLGTGVGDHHPLSPGISHLWECHCWEVAGLGSRGRRAVPHLVPAWKRGRVWSLSSHFPQETQVPS